MKFYVLITIDGRTHILTEQQKQLIVAAMNSGQVKTVDIGDDTIVLSSISGIPTMPTYQRQMKFKLAAKGLRMCDRCGTVVPRMEKCPCKERPEKYPDILEQVRAENPALAAELDDLAALKQFPPLADA